MHFLSIASVLTVAATALPTIVQRDDYTGTGALSYSQLAVLHHNYHRENHSAPAVVWDDDLAATAKKIADECDFEHKM